MAGNSFSYKSVHIVSCHVGYTLVGSKIRKCLANGSWSGRPATCAGMRKDSAVYMAAVSPIKRLIFGWSNWKPCDQLQKQRLQKIGVQRQVIKILLSCTDCG